MPRQRDPRRDEAFRKWKESNGTKLLKDIAAELDCQPSQIRKWKSQDKWDEQLNGNVTKPKRSVTKQKKQGGQPGNRGNPKPTPKFPKRNKAAEKHGFFSKFLPQETLDIVEGITEAIPMIDLLWQQITIQYAAILRSQRIMYVYDQEDTTRVVKKHKESADMEETEWEIQFAWDKQATFLQAQSRAISTLQSLIRQYEEMIRQGHADEEQSLRIEKMKAEIDKIKGGGKGEETEEWIAGLKAVANKRRQLKGEQDE